MRIDVYRNLHKPGFFSVKDLKTGRIVDHSETVIIRDVKFVVQPGGLARVRKTGQRNVHAFVRGARHHDGTPERVLNRFTDSCKNGPNWVEVTYNPHVYDSFVYKDTKEPIHKSGIAICTNNTVYVPRGG